MATYVYEDDEGNQIEFSRSIRFGAPKAVLCGGRLYRRSYGSERTVRRAADPWVNHESLALMCPLGEIENRQRDALAKGLGVVDWNRRNGRPIFRSASQKRKYLRAYGYTDLNSYY